MAAPFLNIFPDALIELNREVRFHPELQLLLSRHRPDDWENRIAEIGVYCRVALDGYYAEEELIQLCELLLKKLQEKRTITVIQ